MRTPGRTRASYCWPHAYRAPAPTPTASRRPTTNETPKRRASDRRRRGRAGGSSSVTAAARGRTGTASTTARRRRSVGGRSTLGRGARRWSLGHERRELGVAAPDGAASPARATSAASSGSPAGVSPSGVEVLATGSAAELGRSVIRCSCAVGRCRASSLAAAISSRAGRESVTRRSARPAGLGRGTPLRRYALERSSFQVPSEMASTLPSTTRMAGLVVHDVRPGRRVSAAQRSAACERVRREDVQVREDREVDDPQRAVVRRRRPLHEEVADPRGHHHAPGAHPHPGRVGQRRQEVGEPGCPHPVVQVRGVAAVARAGRPRPGPRDRALGADAWAGRSTRGGRATSTPTRSRPPLGGRPVTKPRAVIGPHIGWPHCAVGTQSAVASPIGMPSMLDQGVAGCCAFVTPPEVRSSFTRPPCLLPGRDGPVVAPSVVRG